MDVIICDSTCDLDEKIAKKLNIKMLTVPFYINDKIQTNILVTKEDHTSFYAKLKKGAKVYSKYLQEKEIKTAIENQLKLGNNVLFIHPSITITQRILKLNSIIDDLKVKYPERQLYLLDSLGVSGASGLLVYICAKMLNKGESLKSVYEYALNKRNKIACYFSVLNLNCLKNGSIISQNQTSSGAMLGVRPILRINGTGHIVKQSIAKGKTMLINNLANAVLNCGENVLDYPIIIMYVGCEADVAKLKCKLQEKLGTDANIWICSLGAVTSAYSGIGTLGIAFHASKK